MLQGMEHVFVGTKKRNRKGIPTTLLSRDQLMQIKIAAKQRRIQE
jgi:hypothetical protein